VTLRSAEELEALAFDADIAYFKAFTARGGGTVLDEGGVVSWRSLYKMPFLVNTVVRTDRSVAPAEVIRQGDARFEGGYEILCLVGSDDDLLEEAVEQGGTAGDADPLQMLLDLDSLGDPTVPSSIELRTVTDANGVADLAAVNRNASAVYGFAGDLFPTVFRELGTVLADDIEAVVAYERDRPVATAQVFFHGEIGYVGWVATSRKVMRRGLGTLVTHDVVARARQRGAELMSLMASPMGAPIYRRMGFVDVGWVRGVQRSR
jgi:GNAT superfamily N-acetyltransferase